MVTKKIRKSPTAVKRSGSSPRESPKAKARRLSSVRIKKEEMGYLEEMLDEDSMRIVGMLTRGEMTDCMLAEKLGLRANTVRRACNELHLKGMLTYRKEKQKNGWYDYIWWIKDTRVQDIILNKRDEYMNVLKEKAELESQTQYFICKDNCQRSTRMNHEQMLESGSVCPACGSILTAYDNQKEVESLTEEIARVKEI